MEQAKVNKSNWIALICAGVVAVALMIIEGALGRYTAIYAIGAVLETLGALTMITLYSRFDSGAIWNDKAVSRSPPPFFVSSKGLC